MGKWNNFFLQQMGVDGNGSPYPVKESVVEWGVWCKDIPFKLFDKVKEPAKRSWYDEHGDDEYIPKDGLLLEAYTMKVELGCKIIEAGNKFGSAAVDNVRDRVGAFLEELRKGMFKLYSSYTRIGRQNVRLESVSDNAKWVSESWTERVNGQIVTKKNEFLVFEITLKVNDPITDVSLP